MPSVSGSGLQVVAELDLGLTSIISIQRWAYALDDIHLRYIFDFELKVELTLDPSWSNIFRTMEPVEDVVTIASLPGEVLAEIFKSGTTLSSPPGCLPCLLTYSAVNGRWRSAAFDYPDLWASINVPFSARNVAALIAICLERSKSCLFNITITLPESPEMPVVISVMLLVVQHVARLRRLAITASSFVPNAEEIFGLLQNAQRTPRLAALELIFSDQHLSVNMGIPPGGLLMQAPSLSSLRLQGVASPVPFVGLRSLDIQGLRTTYADFRDMVVASPLLAELILPKLRLMLNPCHDLLSLLCIPNLEYLELAGGNIPDLAKSFQDPSVFTKLRTLRLVNVSFMGRVGVRDPEIDNCDYLRALTTVECLEFIHSHPANLLPSRNTVNQSGAVRSRTRSISREMRLRPLGVPRRDPSVPQVTQATELSFPNLRSISLDTLLAAEALWLYHVVLERPQIQVVKISSVTERHLATSMRMVEGVLQTAPHTHLKQLSQSDSPPVHVGKLLQERVVVKEIDNDGCIRGSDNLNL
ncbi:hypothetical protein DFH06DRAFT_1289236 [Mycena polygramma]|nr:hypothetical protein DFH06DRAFT_1289236 [Mycena polygramma]